MKFKAIIFDFDGVIIDNEKIHLQAYNQVFQTLGFFISEKEYFKHYTGLSDYEIFKIILTEKNNEYTSNQIKTLKQSKIDAYKSIINNKILTGLEGLHRFIKSYADKVKHFAICSGATREEIEITLSKLENGKLSSYFRTIITIDDISTGKPSPEGYLLTAKQLDVCPDFCLVIEDTPRGIAAAKNAGMSVVAITTSYHRSALGNADFIANNYMDIDNWIKNF